MCTPYNLQHRTAYIRIASYMDLGFHDGQQACLQEPASLGFQEDSISHGSLRCSCRKVLAAVCDSTCVSLPHYLPLTVAPLINRV